MSSEMATVIFSSVLVGVLLGLAIQVLFLLALQRALERCAPQNRTLSPGLVWLSMIPLFNIVWQFILINRIASSLRREFDTRQTAQPGQREDYGYGVGLAMCILSLASIIPLAGIVCGLAGFVCWIVYWVKIAGYSRTLEGAGTYTTEIDLAQGERYPQPQEAHDLGRGWPVLVVLMWGWGATYLQRVTLSVLAPSLQRELSLTTAQLGWVLSAFAIGLMAGYVLMTVVTVVCGTRWGLLVAFVGASLAAFASGLASTPAGMIIARSLLGFFTGGLLPAAVQSVREWFPSRQRPLAIGLLLASGQAAAALTPTLAPYVAQALAWRTVLIITGLPTVIAAVLCIVVWQSPPPREKSRGVSTAAIASTGMLALGLFLTAPVSYFMMTWLPMYVRQNLGVGLARVGTAGLAAGVAGVCGAILAGTIAWAMIRTGISATKTRAVLLTVCGAMLPLVALGGNAARWEFVILSLVVCSAAYQGWSTLLYSAVADTLPARGVAIVTAIGALMVSLSGMLSPVAFGSMIQTSGYDLVFRILAAGAAGALLWVGFLAWFVRQEPANS
jgi:ACS family hexuronate transporter-like MFS transporter